VRILCPALALAFSITVHRGTKILATVYQKDAKCFTR